MPRRARQYSESELRATKRELERLTLSGCIGALNARFASAAEQEFLQHVDPEFRSYDETRRVELSWAELQQKWQQDFAAFPHTHIHAVHISTDVKLADGYAVQIVDFQIQGLGGLAMQLLAEARWRRDAGGKWWFRHHRDFRGVWSPGALGERCGDWMCE